MQDLVPWPGIERRLPELGAQSLYLTRPPGKSHRQRDLWKSRSDHITAPASCCSTKALQWLSVSPTVAQRSDLIWPLPVSLISSLSTLLVIPELQPHSPFFPFKQTKLNPASGPLHLLFHLPSTCCPLITTQLTLLPPAISLWHQPVLLSKNCNTRAFPGGPLFKTLHFQCKRHAFDPWSGNQDPTCPGDAAKINKY